MEKEQHNPQPPKPFRVIIVGGGLVALTAAHILSKADIDFVILEQHDNLTPWIGSLLVMWPATYRIFNQLGLQDVMRPILNELEDYQTVNGNDGSPLHLIRDVGKMWSNNHGYGIGVTARPQFVNVLHANLPESAKARILVSKKVTNIALLPGDSGVAVHCADGTTEEGTIVIGADGVHSRTRQCMEALALGESAKPTANSTPNGNANTDDDDDNNNNNNKDKEGPYLTTYRALIGNLPSLPGLKPRCNYQGVSYGISPQLVTGEGRGWYYIYEALDAPTRRRRRYTEADKQAMMARHAHVHVAPGYQLRDVFAATVGEIGLINVEEGRVDRWAWGGRVVLVGDAVRKLDPHAGLGYNSGVGDVVDLINRLRRLLLSTQDSKVGRVSEGVPSAAALQGVFDEYQKTRKASERNVHIVSRLSARTSAWLNWGHRVLSTWAMKHLPVVRWMLDYLVAPVVARAPIIDWLEETELPQGASPWLNHPVPEVVE